MRHKGFFCAPPNELYIYFFVSTLEFQGTDKSHYIYIYEGRNMDDILDQKKMNKKKRKKFFYICNKFSYHFFFFFHFNS